MPYLLALDQGTSSSRSILFNLQGEIVASAQREFRQLFPQPGWVEHDPLEIWESQLATCHAVIRQAGIQASDILAIGITNQRETTIVWDKQTGQPLANAIVWQDRRTADQCEQLRAAGYTEMLRQKTGLVPDPYFSATKLSYLLQQIPDAYARAARGEIAFGTVDSWLCYQLSGRQLHVTDVSNASRTMLFNIHTGQWDSELLDLFNIPPAVLPTVVPSAHKVGTTRLFGAEIPLCGIAGDQQAALFGQACLRPGMAKNTYGTGCFMLMHTGPRAALSSNGLITTSACSADGTPAYAMEGSVFIGGAVVQWLRDGLQAIRSSPDVELLAASVPDSGGVVFVPAFTGLGAPYWDASAKGAILGLSRGTTVAHIARAALESIAFQTTVVLQAMMRDAVAPLAELRVDGGAAANQLLLQFQANLLGIPVVRPQVTETTALGAALLAGLGAGVFASEQECASLWRQDRQFLPTMSRDKAGQLMHDWETAIRQVRCP